MEPFIIFIRSIGSIVALFVFTKIMGKKQVSQLNMFDYVLGITIGSVAAEIAVSLESEFYKGIIVMAVYTAISLLVSFITNKSIVLRRFLTGIPIVLMEDGKLLESGLKKAKYDVNDFLEEARSAGYFDISELEYALMESNGKISFLPKSKYAPLTPSDMKVKVDYKGLTSNLVIDGKIMEENLKLIKKDKKWLFTRIKNNKATLNEILLLTCDAKEQITIYKKEEKERNGTVLE